MSAPPSSSPSVPEQHKKLFYTTSDLMRTMNEALTDLTSPEDDLQPKVELQRRLPDGSTRPADEKDLAAADMESKFKQAAQAVSQLSPTEKLQWAEHQKQEGNNLYQQGDYRAALDVYLTCLVAKSTTESSEFLTRIFLPVMNNLAQCSLQMGMYKKTEQFCSIALEEIGSTLTLCDEPLVSKLYFRRGKSRRLRGLYKASRQDLEKAMSLASEDATEKRAIEREIQLVERAALEAERNRKRQKRAMQKELGGTTERRNATPETTTSAITDVVYPDIRPRRKFSTLRARCQQPDDQGKEGTSVEFTYWQWYMAAIGRVADRLLRWLGDDEVTGRSEGKECLHKGKKVT